MRLDMVLVERGVAVSRERAKEIILAGDVMVNGLVIRKPAKIIQETDRIDRTGNGGITYVGRGYLKLEKALDSFHINIFGMHCLDVGASAGGFTQLLLARGASKVTAVDVGSEQLAQVLRDDQRVVSMEKTDIRKITREIIGVVLFACVDVSFISLKLVLEPVFALLSETGSAVCLLKPQFEAGPRLVGKRGVVKDPEVQARVIEDVLNCARNIGFSVCGITHSPIRGGKGNLEYLVYLHKNGPNDDLLEPRQIVQEAWRELSG